MRLAARAPRPQVDRGHDGEWPLLNLQGRIEALEARHRSLEERIFAEDHRPAPDTAELTRLKAEKLRLRDELERLRTGAGVANKS